MIMWRRRLFCDTRRDRTVVGARSLAGTLSYRLGRVDQLPLENRTALVTGASRGIGAATARALDRAGARVALVARNREDLAKVAAGLGRNPVVIPADLREPDAAADTAARALGALGSVDILVNNAAAAARLATTDTDAAIIDEMLAVNVRAPLLLIAALIPAMTERRRGSIINMSSVSGLIGTPRRAAYAASKGAIDAATRSLAIELGPMGIRVNSVAPGVVDTALWASNKKVDGVIEAVENLTPLRRRAEPADIADVITFLSSDAARFITGETISVDGGMAHALDLYGGPV
jgi:NAD(P)-dependent dehydrogenase (short-subunit alcohol dehydrogenase family)